VEGALLKLGWSEWNQRLMNTAMSLLGPEATISGSPWHNHFYYSRAETIFAGSSEIQRNVIGERGLGLPR
jgi:alkylation response protein AidB-like acyl-CoA dehydrogenase